MPICIGDFDLGVGIVIGMGLGCIITLLIEHWDKKTKKSKVQWTLKTFFSALKRRLTASWRRVPRCSFVFSVDRLFSLIALASWLYVYVLS